MKNISFLSAFLLTACLFFNACSSKTKKNIETQQPEMENQIQEGTYFVDSSKSNIEWIGKKPTGSHDGTINIKKGYIEIDQSGNIINGEVIFDMTSISCSDLKGEKKESIEEHLKNADFFDTQNHPNATFKIEKSNENTISGILTIKNISKKISFNYKKNTSLNYVAEIIIDRTLFDIKYKSKTIFPNIGDHFIYDDFQLNLKPLVFR